MYYSEYLHSGSGTALQRSRAAIFGPISPDSAELLHSRSTDILHSDKVLPARGAFFYVLPALLNGFQYQEHNRITPSVPTSSSALDHSAFLSGAPAAPARNCREWIPCVCVCVWVWPRTFRLVTHVWRTSERKRTLWGGGSGIREDVCWRKYDRLEFQVC